MGGEWNEPKVPIAANPNHDTPIGSESRPVACNSSYKMVGFGSKQDPLNSPTRTSQLRVETRVLYTVLFTRF
jgi:hypothetical protein